MIDRHHAWLEALTAVGVIVEFEWSPFFIVPARFVLHVAAVGEVVVAIEPDGFIVRVADETWFRVEIVDRMCHDRALYTFEPKPATEVVQAIIHEAKVRAARA